MLRMMSCGWEERLLKMGMSFVIYQLPGTSGKDIAVASHFSIADSQIQVYTPVEMLAAVRLGVPNDLHNSS